MVLCFMVRPVAAQLKDTTYLNEVRIYGLPVTTYATGSKIEHITSSDEVLTLSDKLINETSQYFKTYGNNQLSTIALRGTTASQTAVLWNGMNINSPTLGQTDFSLIPLFLFDDISIRYGSASALYGSDAIGGSIMIGQRRAQFGKKFEGKVFQEFGSFGKFSTGLGATYGDDQWEFRTKVYRAVIENNFPYESPAVGYSKEQNNAAVTNYGFDQQIHFKISGTQQISAEGMYTYNFREIQPAVTNNQANETLLDRHVRLSLNYQNDSRLGVLTLTTGYILSDQDYEDAVISTARSQQLTALAGIDKSINRKTNLRYGVSYSHYRASSENYVSNVSENRFDGFVSFRYAFLPYWLININLRQSLYANKHAPFAPSFGTEFHLLESEETKLILRAQVARGYRVPTLNDRYWVPGGNPDVTPEDAIHIEGGANWSEKRDGWSYSIDVAVYKSWVNDMIVWVPEGNIWSPTNLQEVNLHGAELNAGASFSLGKYLLKTSILYSYTRSVNEKGQSQSTTDKQLAYVPVHGARFSGSLLIDHWTFNLKLNATGLRYSTLDNERTQALDPYGLLDASLSKQFFIHRMSFRVRAEAFNLVDVYYENLKNHAMPGRHYAISILFNFNNKQPL